VKVTTLEITAVVVPTTIAKIIFLIPLSIFFCLPFFLQAHHRTILTIAAIVPMVRGFFLGLRPGLFNLFLLNVGDSLWYNEAVVGHILSSLRNIVLKGARDR
jgi:hypothetical protein